MSRIRELENFYSCFMNYASGKNFRKLELTTSTFLNFSSIPIIMHAEKNSLIL